MKKEYGYKLLIALIAVLLVVIAVLTAILLWPKDHADRGDTPTIPQMPQQTENSEGETAEDPGVPFTTKYMVLSYPSDLEDVVTIGYEDLPDGQQIVFTTDFTGEELELFRFSISKSGTDGYELGVLNDAEAGELLVRVNVKDYTGGSFAPETYTKLNAMQERVNDIIVQFYEDPRFTPANS